MKNEDCLISVIINTYNGSDFISKSTKSVLSQDYKNIEIIIWDNASTDNTNKIVSNFQDTRVKYIYNSNYRKLYDARNEAIKQTKGHYICFLDVDDSWRVNKLSLQLNKMIDTDSDISFTEIYEKNEHNTILKSIPENYLDKLTDNLLKKNKFAISSVMIKKNILTDHSYSFNSDYNIIGDFDMWFRLSLDKVKFCIIYEPLVTRLIHNKNESKIKIKLFIRELDLFLQRNKKSKINLTNLQNLLIDMTILNLKKLNIFLFIKLLFSNFNKLTLIHFLRKFYD